MGSGGGGDQHFCLRWDNFHSNIATSFEQLRDHEDFVDVTLACEGRTVKAHKVVLSACSPYFRSLLKQNPCQHPIIILRDVAFADVSALLSFVYQGEVYVSQDRLTAFLRTAELLHIKGLTEQQHHHPASAAAGPATSASHDSGSSSSNFGSNVAVSLLAPQAAGGASAPLNHLVATAPHPPHSPIEQGSHPAARGVPRSPSPTRPPSSPSPPPPPPLPYIPPPSHHISPPPKKRRHQPLLVPPSSSPKCSSVEPPLPLSSCPSSSHPPEPQLSTAKLESGVSSIMAGSTLAAALTAPRDMPVVKEPLSSPSPLLLPPLVEVKQEVIDSPFEDTNSNSSAASEQQAVNLSVESAGGSILRQRIQGYQGSPDAPPPPSFSQRSSGTGEEDPPEMTDKKDIAPPTAVAIMRRQHMLGLAAAAAAAGVYTRSGGTTTGSGGSSDQGVHVPPEDNPYEARPCPVCHKSISNRANLKKHLKIRHSEQEEATCPHCHKPFRNKYSLWTHVNSYHPQAKAIQQHHIPSSKAPLPLQKTSAVIVTSTSNISSSGSPSLSIIRHSDSSGSISAHSCLAFAGPSTSGLARDLAYLNPSSDANLSYPSQVRQPFQLEVIRSSPHSDQDIKTSLSLSSISTHKDTIPHSTRDHSPTCVSNQPETSATYALRPSTPPQPDDAASAGSPQHQRPMD